MLSRINTQNCQTKTKTSMKNPNFTAGFQLLGKGAISAYDEFLPTVNQLSKKGKIQAELIKGYVTPRFNVTCERNLDTDTYISLNNLAEKHDLALEFNNIDYYKAIPGFDLSKMTQAFNSNWNNWGGLGEVEGLEKFL